MPKPIIIRLKEDYDNNLDVFLKKLNLEPKPEYYQPCSNAEMIKRLLRNLTFSYKKIGFMDKTDELEKMLKALV